MTPIADVKPGIFKSPHSTKALAQMLTIRSSKFTFLEQHRLAISPIPSKWIPFEKGKSI
jgi:hypothetical protein